MNPRFNPFNSYIEYGKVSIGNNVFINSNAYISGSVVIGDNVLIGPNVTIVNGSGYHVYNMVGKYIRDQGKGEDKKIIIGDDCWIAANVIILSGAIIGEGSVIGAGSLVLKEIPPYSICFGSPCKPVSFRYSDDELRTHYKLLGKSPDKVEEIILKRRALWVDNEDK